ncbi:hypothetical protein BaRGS_00024328, partial [Batillaria attramentaria]
IHVSRGRRLESLTKRVQTVRHGASHQLDGPSRYASSTREQQQLLYWDDGETRSYAAVQTLQNVLVPLIFVFGLVGNSLAAGCFLSESLMNTSCCLYMACKCTADTGFLVTLFVIWLYRVGVGVLNVQGVCQITVFVSYVCGFMSVWLVLAITYENYVRLCRPHLTRTHCTRRVALTVISVITVFAVGFYSFALWTTNVLGGKEGDEEELEPLCMSLIKFKDVIMVMTFIDTVITLVLPSLIIVPLVLASLVALSKSLGRKRRLQDPLLNNNRRSSRNMLEAKVVRFLLTVSLTFLILHTPGHFIRLKQLVEQYILDGEVTFMDVLLQRLFETVYYFDFCCSIVIFLASGSNFRAIFIARYCSRLRCLNRTCVAEEESSIKMGQRTKSSVNEAFDPAPEELCREIDQEIGDQPPT